MSLESCLRFKPYASHSMKSAPRFTSSVPKFSNPILPDETIINRFKTVCKIRPNLDHENTQNNKRTWTVFSTMVVVSSNYLYDFSWVSLYRDFKVVCSNIYVWISGLCYVNVFLDPSWVCKIKNIEFDFRAKTFQARGFSKLFAGIMFLIV